MWVLTVMVGKVSYLQLMKMLISSTTFIISEFS